MRRWTLGTPLLILLALPLGAACKRAPSIADSGTQEVGPEYRGIAVAPVTPTDSVAIGAAPDVAPSAPADSVAIGVPPAPDGGRDRDLKVLLESKVNNGKATDSEVRLLGALCKMDHDEPCRSLVERVRQQRREADWAQSLGAPQKVP
jgi:hypothetical protein